MVSLEAGNRQFNLVPDYFLFASFAGIGAPSMWLHVFEVVMMMLVVMMIIMMVLVVVMVMILMLIMVVLINFQFNMIHRLMKA